MAGGSLLLGPNVSRRLVEEAAASRPARSRRSPESLGLTAREAEVFAHLTKGESNAQIADHLHVAVETVKSHVAEVLRKLGVRDRVQAVVFAYENGLVD